MFNLSGDLVGDVVYALRPEFDGAHGKQLPSTRFGIAGQHCTFVLSGAGVRRGVELKGQVRAVDVMPTIAHLLDLPIPGDTEGRIVYAAVADSLQPASQEGGDPVRPWEGSPITPARTDPEREGVR